MKYRVMPLRTLQFDQRWLAPHDERLDRLRRNGAVDGAGPLTDRSSGACRLDPVSLAGAQAIAHHDPLPLTASSIVSVHEWGAK